MADASDCDVLVVGAGILGVATACWLSGLYDCRIALIDLARSAGAHTSARNTGVIHRPYYLDPAKKRAFVRTALLPHGLLMSLADAEGLPWNPVGTYNVAVKELQDGGYLDGFRSGVAPDQIPGWGTYAVASTL